MKSITFSILLGILSLIFTQGAQAQVSNFTALDNEVIFPSTQSSFNFLGKFASIGESGGVFGQTVTGCDLYGFRAQLEPDIAINMGIQVQDNNGRKLLLPIISTSTDRGLGIAEQNNINGPNALGCGNIIAFFKQDGTGNVLTVFGSATAIGGTFTSSDRNLKRNIQPIANALDIVSQLNGYTYEYRSDERPDLNLPRGQRYGFVTQEVQKIMPTIVRKSTAISGDEADFQVMEYDAIIPVLTEAIKLQQTTITTLEEQNQALEARLARLEALMLKNEDANSSMPQGAVGVLQGSAGVELGQNRPP